MTLRSRARCALAVVSALALSGCALGDLASADLPGGVATSGGYRVTAVFESVTNLVPNSQVLYRDVPVGTVRSISLDSAWHARVVLELKTSAQLPANVSATIGQKSLLGAEYVQLNTPADGEAVGSLRSARSIPLAATSRYPETEEVLSAVSLLLNDGGLAQLKTVVVEINRALSGRTRTTHDLLRRLSTFVSSLDAQKQSIIATVTRLNDFAGTLAAQRDTVARALHAVGPGLRVLNTERGKLIDALKALSTLGRVGTRVINASKAGLVRSVGDLRPLLTQLAKAGKDLPDSLRVAATFPFPLPTLPRVFRGDYANLFVTLDLTLPSLQRQFLSQIPILGTIPLGTSLQKTNPVTNPLGTPHPPPASSPPSSAGSTTPGAKSSRPPTSAPTGRTPAPSPTPTRSCNLVSALLGACR